MAAPHQSIVPCAVIRSEDRVLVGFKVNSSSPVCDRKWELPGGRAESGLSFDTALRRKMRDYLGVDIEVGRLLGVASVQQFTDDRGAHEVFVIPVECRIRDGADPVPNSKKLQELRWITKDEAHALAASGKLAEGDARFIDTALLD